MFMANIIIVKFKEIVAKYADNTALAFLSNEEYKKISYKELNQYRLQLAKQLQEFGWKKGEKVALMLPNSPEWIISDLAVASLGLIVVPIHTTFNEEYIKKVIIHSEAKYLIIHGEYFDKYKEAINKLSLEKIIVVDSSFLSESAKNNQTDDLDIDISEDDVHTIVYTSGTTGDPKGVMLSHRNLITNVDSAKRSIPIYSNDRFFSFLPLSHAFERVAGYYVPIMTGAGVYFAQSPKTIVDDIKKAKPTMLSSVPRIFEKMYGKIFDKVETGSKSKKKLFFRGLKLSVLKRKEVLNVFQKIEWKILDSIVIKKIRNILGGELRMAISGGASLDLKVIKFFDNIGIKVIEGYGMTETSPIISVNKPNNYRFGTVGMAVDCNKVKIDDNKEILVKGSNVMLGYYKNKKLTKEIVDQDSWLHTGDLGFIDKEGFLTIIGRAKDMIVLSTGKNVFPEPIENVLNESRYINQSMVYGDKSKHISAFIVPNFEQLKRWCGKNKIEFNLQSEKIIDFYKSKIEEKLKHVAKVEKIDHFKLIEEEFSQENDLLTPTLKLKRSKIFKSYN